MRVNRTTVEPIIKGEQSQIFVHNHGFMSDTHLSYFQSSYHYENKRVPPQCFRRTFPTKLVKAEGVDFRAHVTNILTHFFYEHMHCLNQCNWCRGKGRALVGPPTTLPE